MPKRAANQTVTAERGVALIQQVVSEMHHLWHPTAGTDSGIDGEIELRDRDGVVRNVRIGVQSKATTKQWAGETDDGFWFLADPDDIEFWLSSSQPVLLICSRPDSGVAYWRSIQEWASHEKARHERRITFDKRRDRFDATIRDQLFNLRAQGTDRVEPPGATAEPERLLTNLMPIRWEHARLHSAAAPAINPNLVVPPRPVVRDGRVWSLRPLTAALIEEAKLDDLKSGPLEPFANSREVSDLNLVRELVKHELIARHRERLRWHPRRSVVYFARSQADWEPVNYVWAGGAGRAVVAPQRAKTRDGFTGYRHDAAELEVRRLDSQWVLQLRPTYLFTWDGKQVSRHHASALSKIKKLDKHSSVSQMLRMWQHLFVERLTLDAPQSNPFELEPLIECAVPRGIADKAWQHLGVHDEDHVDDQTALDFGDA